MINLGKLHMHRHLKSCKVVVNGLGSSRLDHNTLVKTHFRTIVFQVRTEKESLYQLLNVKPSASQAEIKLAYYKLAK